VSFFSGSGGDPPDASEQESLARIEAGGIPLSAEARLRELTGDAPFTSTLSVSEFALMNELGSTALGQVMGASVHQIGWQYLPSEARWGRTLVCSLDRVEHAWDEARRRAFDRMTEEATLLGADAVIGVKLSRGEHDWARGCVDYVVTGTAIRLPGSDGTRRAGLSDLSAQEYWKLVGAGWTPAGLCATTAVFFVSRSSATRFNQWITVGKNQELEDYTRGFTTARRSAVRALRGQAGAAKAGGLVGVTLEHSVHEQSIKTLQLYGYGGGSYGGGALRTGNVASGGRDERKGIVITIQAVGTAIARAADSRHLPTNAILRLGENSR
jgi:uncharacterized protein YbjQ (UPF0145 family)